MRSNTMSTRRLSARPAGVAFEAIGCRSAYPAAPKPDGRDAAPEQVAQDGVRAGRRQLPVARELRGFDRHVVGVALDHDRMVLVSTSSRLPISSSSGRPAGCSVAEPDVEQQLVGQDRHDQPLLVDLGRTWLAIPCALAYWSSRCLSAAKSDCSWLAASASTQLASPSMPACALVDRLGTFGVSGTIDGIAVCAALCVRARLAIRTGGSSARRTGSSRRTRRAATAAG